MQKTLKDWMDEERKASQGEISKEESEKSKQSAQDKKQEEKKKKPDLKPEKPPAQETIEKEIPEPPWRKQDQKEAAQKVDKKAKRANRAVNLQIFGLIFLVISIIVTILYFVYVRYFQIKETTSIPSSTQETTDETSEEDSNSGISSLTEAPVTYYLIEIGTAGTRELDPGEIKIGCGDILVPITETVQFTKEAKDNNGDITDLAKLETALEKLFSHTSGAYNTDRELVTSLSGSSLTIDQVSEVGGDYVVELSGEVSISGVCEAERLQTQIEETAKINITSGDVTFKLNGSSEEYDKIGDLS